MPGGVCHCNVQIADITKLQRCRNADITKTATLHNSSRPHKTATLQFRRVTQQQCTLTQGTPSAITQAAYVHQCTSTQVHVVHLHPVLYFSTVHTQCVMSQVLYMLHCSECSLTLYRAPVHRAPCNPLYVTHCTAPCTPRQYTCITHLHAWPKREISIKSFSKKCRQVY